MCLHVLLHVSIICMFRHQYFPLFFFSLSLLTMKSIFEIHQVRKHFRFNWFHTLSCKSWYFQRILINDVLCFTWCIGSFPSFSFYSPFLAFAPLLPLPLFPIHFVFASKTFLLYIHIIMHVVFPSQFLKFFSPPKEKAFLHFSISNNNSSRKSKSTTRFPC